MNRKIDFIIDGEPQGKARPRFVRSTGHTYTPQNTKNYEAAVAWAYKAADDVIEYWNRRVQNA